MLCPVILDFFAVGLNHRFIEREIQTHRASTTPITPIFYNVLLQRRYPDLLIDEFGVIVLVDLSAAITRYRVTVNRTTDRLTAIGQPGLMGFLLLQMIFRRHLQLGLRLRNRV